MKIFFCYFRLLLVIYFLDFRRNFTFICEVLFSFSSHLIFTLASSSCSFNDLLFFNELDNIEFSCNFEGRRLSLGTYFDIIL